MNVETRLRTSAGNAILNAGRGGYGMESSRVGSHTSRVQKIPLLEICKKNVSDRLTNGCEVLFAHEMAGVSFDHEPHLLSRGELQRIAGGQGEVDFHFDSVLHSGHDDYIALLERGNAAGDYIASAQSDGRVCGQQNVAGADSDAELRAHAAADERGFKEHRATVSWYET